ncbi:poly-beta-1,6 N-acetyl-D-glucosamine synthase [Candidatus Woesebacteria bacterium RBG_19FT_COMBO_47_8]|nr:MAG: poly-beta-1,6 N-acetyl-D-glucosamine synthase [Candidatus Woesebacteria bacterium RBG_19FT_COMBO_47_8]OGP70208.1 MAG: poly-beta-1,6 N-acetyl-D-glucosamine synthase [Deltaproteobacteria bacterium RBG_13_60_28]
MDFISILSYFAFLYPLYMGIVWIIGGLTFKFHWEKKNPPLSENLPYFSIIIPAHNEADIVEETIINLKDLNYPDYGVIVVNDGSTDATGAILDRLVAENSEWLKVIHLEPNMGKSVALDTGILLSKGQFLLVIDADCLLDKDALRYFAWHFVTSTRVGAVTGNPRVRNRTTLLGKIQVGEFSNVIGLIKRTQRILGKILTVSGVLAAYRKSALISCGLFDPDTVTEDIDVTWKLQKKFWDIRYEPRALGWVLVPETVRGLWRQRVRWAQGGIEVLKKHFNVWFDRRYRRLWPVYVEYSLGTLWAVSFTFLVIYWLTTIFFSFLCQSQYIQTHVPIINTIYYSLAASIDPVFPRWPGAILALLCLTCYLTSFMIDRVYEKGLMAKYYFWIIWYPAFYWIISALAAVEGLINVIFKRKGVTSKWMSPDRGIHIQSSIDPK